MKELWHLINHLRQTFSPEIEMTISWEFETACQLSSPCWWCRLRFSLWKGCCSYEFQWSGHLTVSSPTNSRGKMFLAFFLMDNCRLCCFKLPYAGNPYLKFIYKSHLSLVSNASLMLFWLKGIFCFPDLLLNFQIQAGKLTIDFLYNSSFTDCSSIYQYVGIYLFSSLKSIPAFNFLNFWTAKWMHLCIYHRIWSLLEKLNEFCGT